MGTVSVLTLLHRIISIMSLFPDAYANKSPEIQGLLLLGLLVGLLGAELFCSGQLSDKIMVYLTRRNGGERLPEMRLFLAVPSIVLSSIGLVLWACPLTVRGSGWSDKLPSSCVSLCRPSYLHPRKSEARDLLFPRCAWDANGKYSSLVLYHRQLS